jgi:hypothetical protein
MSATYRLAAILAADVVRYSRLNGADEEGIGKEFEGTGRQDAMCARSPAAAP